VARRLKSATRRTSAFEDTLDWLADGAALLRKDGRVLYSNETFDRIVARNDGLRIVKGAIEFGAPQAQARFVATLAAIGRLDGGDPGAPRRLSRCTSGGRAGLRGVAATAHGNAAAPALRRDCHCVRSRPAPSQSGRGPHAARLFHFTAAEANLALAIQAGVSLSEYARQTGLSLNTIYTHLRRIKDKSGYRRLSDLTCRLNELQVPLR